MGWLKLFLVYVFVSFLDIVTTLVAVRSYGFVESNPFINNLIVMGMYGVVVWVILSVLVFIAVFMLSTIIKSRFRIETDIFYLLIIIICGIRLVGVLVNTYNIIYKTIWVYPNPE